MRRAWIAVLCLVATMAFAWAQPPPEPEQPGPLPEPVVRHRLRYRFPAGRTQRLSGRITGTVEVTVDPLPGVELPPNLEFAVNGNFDLQQQLARVRAGASILSARLNQARVAFTTKDKAYLIEISLSGNETRQQFRVKSGGLPLRRAVPLLLTAGGATIRVTPDGRILSAQGGPTIFIGGVLPPSQAAQFFGSGICGLMNLEFPTQPVEIGETWDISQQRRIVMPPRGRGKPQTIPVTVTVAHTLNSVSESGGRRMATIGSEGNIAFTETEVKVGPTQLVEVSYTLGGVTVMDLTRGQIVSSTIDVLGSARALVDHVLRKEQRTDLGDLIQPAIKGTVSAQIASSLRYTLAAPGTH